MTSRLFVINFGSGQAGLTTVGYTLYNKDNTVKQTRKTTGVFEVGTSTGIYAVYLSIDIGFDGIILWDTGTASVRYGVEDTVSQLNSIQDETDNIRLIWNSLRNQGTFYAGLIETVNKLKTIIEAFPDSVLNKIPNKQELLDNIKSIKLPQPIVNIPPIAIPQPIVNIPEVKIPDYSNDIREIKSMISNTISELGKVPKTQKEYASNFNNLLGALDALSKKISDNAGSNVQRITSEIRTLQTIFVKFDGLIQKINELNSKIGNLETSDKEMVKSKKEIAEDVKHLNMFIYDFVNSPFTKEAKESNYATLMFGHKR